MAGEVVEEGRDGKGAGEPTTMPTRAPTPPRRSASARTCRPGGVAPPRSRPAPQLALAPSHSHREGRRGHEGGIDEGEPAEDERGRAELLSAAKA